MTLGRTLLRFVTVTTAARANHVSTHRAVSAPPSRPIPDADLVPVAPSTAAGELSHEARNTLELMSAVQMVASGNANGIQLGGFHMEPDQVARITVAAADFGVRIVPTIAFGGGALDIVVRRDL
jgi:hypothetical protein